MGGIIAFFVIFMFSSEISWKSLTYEVDLRGAFSELQSKKFFLQPGMHIKTISRKPVARGGEGAFVEFVTIGNLDYYKVQIISWIILKREPGLRCIPIAEEYIIFSKI